MCRAGKQRERRGKQTICVREMDSRVAQMQIQIADSEGVLDRQHPLYLYCKKCTAGNSSIEC
jgi:hypothetical protein